MTFLEAIAHGPWVRRKTMPKWILIKYEGSINGGLFETLTRADLLSNDWVCHGDLSYKSGSLDGTDDTAVRFSLLELE